MLLKHKPRVEVERHAVRERGTPVASRSCLITTPGNLCYKPIVAVLITTFTTNTLIYAS
jgi:hypothetical protein